jgi:hypothetical protein
MKFLMAAYLQMEAKTSNQKNEKIHLEEESMMEFKK